jgi:hypothetical protein
MRHRHGVLVRHQHDGPQRRVVARPLVDENGRIDFANL